MFRGWGGLCGRTLGMTEWWEVGPGGLGGGRDFPSLLEIMVRSPRPGPQQVELS